MRHFRFRCKQLNDEHPEWGLCWWMTEYSPKGYPKRVMYLYDSGVRLRYHEGHHSDDYGGILLMTLEEIIDGGDEEVTKVLFETEWQTGPWLNDRNWARRNRPDEGTL